jgi:1-deoxy-D-xylulose-5-phosphate synthase
LKTEPSSAASDAIVDFMSENGYTAHVKKLGIPDYYVEQGTIEELHHECGFDKEGILRAVKKILDPSI